MTATPKRTLPDDPIGDAPQVVAIAFDVTRR
jgi:hypothetical protein